jgi:hypothetical protein
VAAGFDVDGRSDANRRVGTEAPVSVGYAVVLKQTGRWIDCLHKSFLILLGCFKSKAQLQFYSCIFLKIDATSW